MTQAWIYSIIATYRIQFIKGLTQTALHASCYNHFFSRHSSKYLLQAYMYIHCVQIYFLLTILKILLSLVFLFSHWLFILAMCHFDCGGSFRGNCTSPWVCTCKLGYTGTYCTTGKSVYIFCTDGKFTHASKEVN